MNQSPGINQAEQPAPIREQYRDFVNGADTSNAQVSLAVEDLVRSGLTAETIAAAKIKIYRGKRDDLKHDLGFSSIDKLPILHACTLIEFPYFDRFGTQILHRFKLIPAIDNIRYLSPRGRPTPPYILPSVWEIADNPHKPLWITEGEKKALKLIQHGEPCIALPGVWGFKAGKHSREDELSKALWDDLRAFDWRGRTVYLAFDADLWTNLDVRYALVELAIKLWALGAIVRFPEWYKPKGIDDYICQHDQAETAVLNLKKNSREFLAFIKPENAQEALRAVAVSNLSPTKRHQIEVALSKALKIPKGAITKDIEARIPKKDPSEGLDGLFERYSLIYGSTEVWDRDRCESMKIDAFRNLYPMTAKVWTTSPRKRVINREDIVFEPAGALDHQINMFKGWPMKPDASKPHQLLVGHILHLCGNEELCHWVTCWLAWPLKHPGAKMATALVFHGGQGTGKSIFFEALASIYGDYGAVIDQPSLESTFTGWSGRKLFVLAEEVISNLNQANVKNRLKGLITGSRIWINKKGIEPREESNHMNMVFLSNHDIPVLLDDDDRRFTVIRIDNKRETDYYAALGKEIKEGGAAGLYHYLMNYPMSGFEGPHAKPPQTEAKDELRKICQNSILKFIGAWKDDALPIPYISCLAHPLYVAYRCFCRSTNEYLFSETRFGLELKRHYTTTKTDRGRLIEINKTRAEIKNEDYTAFEEKLNGYVSSVNGGRQ